MEKYFSKLLLALFLTVTFFSCKKAIETDNSNDNSNGTGYIYNAYSNLPIFQIPLGGGSGSIPPSYDLTPFMPPIRNQNPQNSCVGFCLATLKSFHERLEYGYTYSGNDKIMSPAFIYNQKKSGANCKAGTDPVVALDFLKTDGISTEAEFPFDENDCSSIPSNLIKVSALKNKIRAWEAFNFQNNPNVLSEIKYAISQMQPVIAGIKIDNEFKSRDLFSWGTNIWKQNNSTTPVENGHCVLLVGYDDAKNAFKLLNSWGTWWKNDGYCWVDYSWFLQRKLNAFMTYDEFHTTSTGNLEIIGALDYGNVTINTTSTKTIQLKNNGTTNINISNVSITSPYSTNWSSGVITPN